MAAGAARAAQGQQAQFEITLAGPGKDANKIEASGDRERTIFDITSPGGIGRATVRQPKDGWPKAIAVRIHLGGMENFSVSNGKTTLRAGVLSHGDNRRLLHTIPADTNRESPALAKDSPYWMDIKVSDAAGRPAEKIPVKGGCFEMTLPAALLEDGPKSLAVSWIDFYR